MTVWDTYPNLSGAELRTLVAVASQVLLESEDARDLPAEFLQQSPRRNARDITALLPNATVTESDVRQLLEDDELGAKACLGILDELRKHPALAERIASEFEARKQKMTGVELSLLAGALLVLALRIKRVHASKGGVSVDFSELPAKAVEVVTALTGVAGRS